MAKSRNIRIYEQARKVEGSFTGKVPAVDWQTVRVRLHQMGFKVTRLESEGISYVDFEATRR